MPPANSYSKGACQHCGCNIEFPTAGAGQTIPCPHCGRETLLAVSQGASVEVGGGATARRRICLFFGLVAVLVAAAGAYLLYLRQAFAPNPAAATPPAHPANATNAGRAAVPPSPPPDPWHGLKAGAVSLERSGDGRLIYAIGTVRNTSGRQRFGVKVELEVLDGQDNKLGSATDYAPVIEPGKEWKFRALVTDKQAATARLTNINEQE